MQGELIEFELSSADVTTAAELSIRTSGAFEARTLEADERILLRDITIFAADATVLVTIFADADGGDDVDAHERLVEVGPGTHTIDSCGRTGAKGIVPHVIADTAGQVSITGTGVIIKG